MVESFNGTAERRVLSYKAEAYAKMIKQRRNKQLSPWFTESELSHLIVELFERVETLENELNERKAAAAFRGAYRNE